MVLRVLVVSFLLTSTPPSAVLSTSERFFDQIERGSGPAVAISDNDFIPEDQNLGDCISAAPPPGCGSKAQGGWAQNVVFAAVLGGLGFIGWRIVAGSRKAKRGT